MTGSEARIAEGARRMTYEEFLEQCDESGFFEWVDGYMVREPNPSLDHQETAEFLARVLGIFAEQRGLGRVIIAPFQMKTGPDLAGREPDVLFVATEHLDRLGKRYLNGPADLAVEVVSPESRLRDRGEKLAEYEMGGVREYWVLDPEKQQADFYVLGADGRYERRRADAHGVYRSQVVTGFWLREEWLWQDPPPKTLGVLRELGLV
jgi:Uma2 family endonuclease